MRLLFAVAALLFTVAAPARADAPAVVASVKPLHSLVAAVMQGAGTPVLLLDAGASPHSYSLRPSDARALAEAKLVFIVGAGLEAFLDKPLKSLGAGSRVVAMADAPGVKLLPGRAGGLREHDHQEHSAADSHLWLDPDNAQAFIATAAAALAEVDPANAATYRRNAEVTSLRIGELDAELARALQPVKGVPYIVFHDAYQYFEAHYGLSAAGSVTISPERQPSPKRVSAIRQRIAAHGARCVFREPQFSPKLVDTLSEGTDIRTDVLDPVGTTVPPGPDAWFAMMRGLAESLRRCLA